MPPLIILTSRFKQWGLSPHVFGFFICLVWLLLGMIAAEAPNLLNSDRFFPKFSIVQSLPETFQIVTTEAQMNGFHLICR